MSMSTIDKTVKVKPAKGFLDEEVGPRRERQIRNRMHYRLNKRRNLWLRSIAAAKDEAKITVLKAKVEALDFALKTLGEV